MPPGPVERGLSVRVLFESGADGLVPRLAPDRPFRRSIDTHRAAAGSRC
jgi:hypothetical protein